MKQILGIDFGSTYTKVAVREEWTGESELLGDFNSDPLFNFCYPTTVACVTKKSGKKKWLTGEEALELLPGEGVRIYQNWKQNLFLGDELDAEYETVAVQFFSALFQNIEETFPDLARSPIRICIPHLKGNRDAKEVIQAVLRKSGAKFVAERPILFEPEGNALGVVTRGRNESWTPRASINLEPNFGMMFERDEGGLFEELRKCTLRSKEFHYTILVVDIGSFTADFGSVTFNVTNGNIDDFSSPNVIQESKPIGICKLDEAVLSGVRREVRKAIAARPYSEWEQIKVRIYKGEEAQIVRASGGRLTIGQDGEAEIIAKAVESYAKGLVRECASFCRTHDIEPRRTVLTGGGSFIKGVKKRLISGLQSKLGTEFYDLADPDEPYRVLLQKATEKGWVYDERAVEQRRVRNREIVRGGAAFGGCSVVLDLPIRLVDR